MKRVSCKVRTEFYILFIRNFVELAVVNNLHHIIKYTVSNLIVFSEVEQWHRRIVRGL
jgi:hypothetical protein